ncbi:MAG: anti-sigma factor antagonist [Solirubrobacteraceae bacterium]|jgi:anti-anti-sigma factor|nr:anti-sigma factor antagonist [Solirubrobacteraceae bacterium]
MRANGTTTTQQTLDPPGLRLHSHGDEERHVIELAGELDAATAARFEQELRRVELTPVRLIVLDLRELTFIDSTGVRLMLQAERRSSQCSNRVVLIRGRAAVHRTFEICDLATRLPFVDELPPRDANARGPALLARRA